MVGSTVNAVGGGTPEKDEKSLLKEYEKQPALSVASIVETSGPTLFRPGHLFPRLLLNCLLSWLSCGFLGDENPTLYGRVPFRELISTAYSSKKSGSGTYD